MRGFSERECCLDRVVAPLSQKAREIPYESSHIFLQFVWLMAIVGRGGGRKKCLFADVLCKVKCKLRIKLSFFMTGLPLPSLTLPAEPSHSRLTIMNKGQGFRTTSHPAVAPSTRIIHSNLNTNRRITFGVGCENGPIIFFALAKVNIPPRDPYISIEAPPPPNGKSQQSSSLSPKLSLRGT